MADRVTAKAEADKSYAPHPEGGHAFRCVDVVNYGPVVGEWQGQVKVQPKVGLFFQSGQKNEQGQLHTVAMEFTLSMWEKANLRKFLEGWRGRSYSDEQAEAGIEIHKLENHGGYGTVEWKRSQKGRDYAVMIGMIPLPQGFATPELPKYDRPEYVTKRKQEYADAYAKYMAAEGPSGDGHVREGTGPGKPGSAVTGSPNRDTSFDDFPESLDDDSSELPF